MGSDASAGLIRQSKKPGNVSPRDKDETNQASSQSKEVAAKKESKPQKPKAAVAKAGDDGWGDDDFFNDF